MLAAAKRGEMHSYSDWAICSARASGVADVVCTKNSGFKGASYGLEIPVNAGISPRRALA